MCGILGIFGHDNISRELLFGLTSIQHRGQDAAGIATFDRIFRVKKGPGLIHSVFSEADMRYLSGNCGIAHVRYSTVGSNDPVDAQPLHVNYPFGLAMAHNGNVINYDGLRKSLGELDHRLVETSNDVELILYTFASELEKKNLRSLSVDDIFDAVEATQKRVQGSYSTLTIIAGVGFLVFTDPCGIRPLVMGKKITRSGPAFIFASETTVLDALNYEFVKDLEPGEAIFIDMQRKVHSRICHRNKGAFCVFEYIYFAREDSRFHGRLVAKEREKLGRALAGEIRARSIEVDFVTDVPSSSFFAAQALAEELGVPYRKAFSKNKYVGRTFISPTPSERELMVRQKLVPIEEIVRGKRIAVVDDSIVRGTTSRHIVNLLREKGAREICFVSAAPPVRFPCIYGIDMSIKRELIAANHEEKDIARYLGVDSLVYQPLHSLTSLYRDVPCCYACFDGNYVTGVSPETLLEIEKSRILAKEVLEAR